jgi:hypothetical protein
VTGRWCSICRLVASQYKKPCFAYLAPPRTVTEKAFTEKRRPKRTLRQCFLKGRNSTCRGHIASNHFEEYERLCKAMKVKVNHRCIPEAVVLARKVKGKEKVPTQSKLEFGKVVEFTREGTLEAVAKFIACDNQVHQCLMLCATF